MNNSFKALDHLEKKTKNRGERRQPGKEGRPVPGYTQKKKNRGYGPDEKINWRGRPVGQIRGFSELSGSMVDKLKETGKGPRFVEVVRCGRRS